MYLEQFRASFDVQTCLIFFNILTLYYTRVDGITFKTPCPMRRSQDEIDAAVHHLPTISLRDIYVTRREPGVAVALSRLHFSDR